MQEQVTWGVGLAALVQKRRHLQWDGLGLGLGLEATEESYYMYMYPAV